jgi:hypothetical protein
LPADSQKAGGAAATLLQGQDGDETITQEQTSLTESVYTTQLVTQGMNESPSLQHDDVLAPTPLPASNDSPLSVKKLRRYLIEVRRRIETLRALLTLRPLSLPRIMIHGRWGRGARVEGITQSIIRDRHLDTRMHARAHESFSSTTRESPSLPLASGAGNCPRVRRHLHSSAPPLGGVSGNDHVVPFGAQIHPEEGQ